MISKDMRIEEVVQKYPDSIDIFTKHGLHCIHCMAASYETIEQGSVAHGITVDNLISDLNNLIK